MATKKEIIEESRRRHPKSKPMHYLTEGQAMGFIEGALWMKKLIEETTS